MARKIIGTENVPHYVTTDENKLRQVLINLLGNAVKFTDKGGRVEIDAELAADGGCLFQVADNGCGMDPAEIPKALTPFAPAAGSVIANRTMYRATGPDVIHDFLPVIT